MRDKDIRPVAASACEGCGIKLKAKILMSDRGLGYCKLANQNVDRVRANPSRLLIRGQSTRFGRVIY